MRSRLRLKIGPRIFLGFSSASLLTLAVALVSISYLRSVGEDLATVADRDRVLQTRALELRIAVAEESDGVRGYLLSGDQALLAPFTAGRSRFSNTARELRSLVKTEEDIRLLSDAESLHATFLDVAEEQVTLHDQGFPRSAVFLWQLQGSQVKTALDGTLAEFIDRQDETIAEHTRNSEREQDQALAISLGLVGLALAAGTAGGIWISRSITSPLAHLVRTAARITEGDLRQTARVDRTDELGILARAFNSMTMQLRNLIEGLEHRVADRTRELTTLEELGRAIINGPPDAATLPDLLGEYVPAMFPGSEAEVRMFPDRTLFCNRGDTGALPDPAWGWVARQSEARFFGEGDVLPWSGESAPAAAMVAPILAVEAKEPIGAIHVSFVRNPEASSSLLPAVQSLAAQIGSALEGARLYAQEIAHENVARELALAGQIQARFLPDQLPAVPGWQLSAALKPAKETSGDFYDVIPLPSGRLGLLIADVADKGMGAALYMALSRTLIRTYALEHDLRPELALAAANRRILEDTGTGGFVTVFYGVLDPASGDLTYSNAGHNPPYLLRPGEGGAIDELPRTGVPLGILAGAAWQRDVVHVGPGDVLLMYTDGIPEAQDAEGSFFDEENLLDAVRPNLGCSSSDIQDAVLSSVAAFVDDAPQFDDITMMVVVRDVS